MTMDEAITQLPAWIGYWMYVLMIGGFALPFVLLIWKESRIAGVFGLVTGILSGLGVTWIYGTMGYVNLLGVPHILFWTPFAIYLIARLRCDDLRPTPRTIMMIVLAVVVISLVFDFYNLIEWILGDRAPLPGTAPLTN